LRRQGAEELYSDLMGSNIQVPLVANTYNDLPILATVRSNTWVCGSSIVGIGDSNPGQGMDVRRLGLLCVV